MALGRLLGVPVRQALTLRGPVILEGIQHESILLQDLERLVSSYGATTSTGGSTNETSASSGDSRGPIPSALSVKGPSLGPSIRQVLHSLPWSASLFSPVASFSTMDTPETHPTSDSSLIWPETPEQGSKCAPLKVLSQAHLPLKAHSAISSTAGRHMATSSLSAQPEVSPSADLQAKGATEASKALPPLPPRKKTKALTKTAQHIMNILDQEAVAELKQKKNYPEFRAGDVLELDLIVPENRRRTQVVRGVCIARRNSGIGSSFVIRRVVAGEGMEYTYPLYSPNIQKIKIVERRPVRRSKLYFLREWNPRECTV